MKAAILVKQNHPLVLADIELPEELDYGQVLVKLEYSAICGAQINEIDGAKGPDKFLPHLLGHEGTGAVKKVGRGVTKVKAGDHVVLHWRKGAGIESPTPKYSWNSKLINAGYVTTFNEMAVVSENRLTPIPQKTDLLTATLYGCAVTTAYGVIHNDAKLKSGESIIVFGTGGAGAAIIKIARLANAHPIAAVDVNNLKLKMAQKFGADKTFIFSKNIKEEILKLFPQGTDAAIDTTGLKKVRELAYEITANWGRTILVGVPKKGDTMEIDSFPLHFDKILTGSFGGSVNPTDVIPRLISLEQKGSLDFKGMITKIYPLEKINDAIREIRTGNVIRVALKL